MTEDGPESLKDPFFLSGMPTCCFDHLAKVGSVPVAGLDEEWLEVGHAFRGLVVAAALHLDLGRGGLDLGAFVG
jgi:hypothetical protein